TPFTCRRPALGRCSSRREEAQTLSPPSSFPSSSRLPPPAGLDGARVHLSSFVLHPSSFILHRSPPAFTLVEILVTMAMLSFIVLGLLATFNQVQRAFQAAQGQTDFLETGRSAMNLMNQDLEQMAALSAP